MAWSGRHRELSASDVTDHTTRPADSRQMNRAHNFAESAYFIHQRYEDTALVIFQQQAKKKKESKKNLSQHQTLPYQVQVAPPTQQQLSPGKGRGPRASPGLESSANSAADSTLGNSSPRLPSLSPGNSPKVGPPSVKAQSVSSGAASEDGLASGGVAGAASSEALLASKPDAEISVPVTKQSDIILSHPLSNIEPESTCGSAVDSPLQSSTHSDITNPTSENTTSANSAIDSLFPSDTESDTAVKPDDPDTDEENTRVSECDIKADFAHPTEEEGKPNSPDDEVNDTLSEDKVKHIVPEREVKETSPEKEVRETLPEREVRETLPEREVKETSPEKEVKETLPEREVKETLPEREVKETLPEREVKETLPGEEVKESLPGDKVRHSLSEEEKHILPDEDVKDTSPEGKTNASPEDEVKDALSEKEKNDLPPEETVNDTSPVTASQTANLPEAAKEVKHAVSEHGVGQHSDLPEVKRTQTDRNKKRQLSDVRDVYVQDEVKRTDGLAAQPTKSAEHSTVGGRVSGVEFAHFGSAGVVARRKVAMTKSDRAQTQSRVCVVM